MVSLFLGYLPYTNNEFLSGSSVVDFPGVVSVLKTRSARAGFSLFTLAFFRLRLTVCIVLPMKLSVTSFEDIQGLTCYE